MKRYLIVVLTALLLALPAAAWSGVDPAPPATAPQTKVLTGKERLSGKAADPQRVNDCKVPKDLRGDSERPDDCGHLAKSAKTAKP